MTSSFLPSTFLQPLAVLPGETLKPESEALGDNTGAARYVTKDSGLIVLSLTFSSCKTGIIRPPLQGLINAQVISGSAFKKTFESRDHVYSLV